VAAIVVAAALPAGCGGDGGSRAASAPTSVATATTTETATTTTETTATRGLAHPIYPTCGVERFNPPTVNSSVKKGTRIWQIAYALPPNAPTIAGQSTQLTLLEYPATTGHKHVAGGHDVRLGGKVISVKPKTTKSPVTLASWSTRRARYFVVDLAGVSDTLRQFVRCLA
jgi:hypothetical protein